MQYLRFLKENAAYLAVGILLSFLSSFGQTFFIAIFGGEIRDFYGLTNGEWGGLYTLGTAASAVVMLWAGTLTDRFRVRVIGSGVVALLGVSCVAMSMNTSLYALPFLIMALRFFGQGMSVHVAVVAMARWFIATRGRALAVATMGFSIAEAALPLTFVWLKTFFDWRELWAGSALFCFAMLPLLIWLLARERTPQSVAKENSAFGMDGRFWTRSEVLRHPLFWSLVPALLSFPAFGTAFWFHQVHFAELKGWDHLSFVAIFPFGTASFIASTFLFGWLIDRFGTGRLLPIYLIPLVVGFTLHWYGPSLIWSVFGVIFMGLAGGGQATLPAACWAEYYGTKHIGAIKSVVAAVMVLGSAIGPGLSGWLIDLDVDFRVQLLAYAALFAACSLIMLPALRNSTARLTASS